MTLLDIHIQSHYDPTPMPSQDRQKPPGTFAILLRAFSYLTPYRRKVIFSYIMMMAINGIIVLTPLIIRTMVDRGIYGGDLDLLSWAALGLLGITLGKGLLTYQQGVWTEQVSQGVAYDLRNQLQRRLTELSFSFHDTAESGQILSRAMQDVERIRFLTGRAVLRLVEGGVLLLITGIAMVSMDWKLGLLVMLTLPLLLHRAYVFGRQFRPLSIEIQDQLGILTARLEQNLRGAQVVKAFAQEDAEIERFLKENRTWFDLSAQAARIQSVNAPMLDLFANLGTVFIIWYGGLQVVQGDLSVGTLVAFTTYMAQLIRPIGVLGRIIPVLAIAASAGERIFSILDADSSVEDSPDARPLQAVRGQVRFDNVSFGYDHRYPVLKEISFTAEPGQVIALLGPTGSGKSSIINLITRFYNPTGGRVLLDGHNLQDIQLRSLRSQIGMVMQENVLFAASIRENIAFGRPDATDNEVIAAARDAQVHDFIATLPEGYDTHVGERGMTLSGGQKQRLAIARALLAEPRILILDDATSSVDMDTEKKIQIALTRLMRGRTTFIIAHRLSSIRKADRILVLENGEITASGTHEELLGRSSLYAEVHRLQAGPEVLA